MSNAGILITWPQLLYVGIVVLSFYLAELLFFWLRHGRKSSNPSDLLQQQVTQLRQELDAIKVRLAALSLSLHHDDQDVGSSITSQPLTNSLHESSLSAESPYAHAIRLAQTGANAPEVAASCGISRGEADLIVAIYRTERS